MPPQELADFNGIQSGDTLREGEILALPRRVAEPSAATGAVSTAPLGSPGAIRLHGVVTDGAGAPVPDALVEIRQADADSIGRQ